MTVAENNHIDRRMDSTVTGARQGRAPGEGGAASQGTLCFAEGPQFPVRRPIARAVYKPHHRRPAVDDPVPIWVAALFASHCQARVNGHDRSILWQCAGDRVLYTNAGPETEQIEPLGVSLQRGQTLAVSWTPGETAYTIEVFRHLDCCA